MIIYYSGTGNSRYCAEYLGATLDDEVVDAFKYMRSGIAPDFFSDEPWIFVSPTYCWRLPRIFEEFIRILICVKIYSFKYFVKYNVVFCFFYQKNIFLKKP